MEFYYNVLSRRIRELSINISTKALVLSGLSAVCRKGYTNGEGLALR